jgi:hypothetical protein
VLTIVVAKLLTERVTGIEQECGVRTNLNLWIVLEQRKNSIL